MPEGSPGAGALKYGSSILNGRKNNPVALSCHMGKRSRVTRYVINKSFVYDKTGSEPVKPGRGQAAHTESGSCSGS